LINTESHMNSGQTSEKRGKFVLNCPPSCAIISTKFLVMNLKDKIISLFFYCCCFYCFLYNKL